MHDFHVRPATADDLPALARLVHRLNADPAARCVQSATGDTAEAIEAELRREHGEGNLHVVLAERHGAAVGMTACAVDPEVGRGWIRGPLVDGEPWDAIADGLHTLLRRHLAPSIRRIDAYLDAANGRGHRFYADRGFRRIRTVHVYGMDRPEAPIPAAPEVHPLRETEIPSFAALHETLFAEGGVPGRTIAARLDDAHRVLTIAEGDRVLGYVEVTAGEEGFVEHLGVDPAAQGRGLGGRLLAAALRWCFEERGMPRAGLAVDDERGGARRLYERSGFRLEESGVNLRWEGA